MSFGDIYYFPRLVAPKKNLVNHWAVVLFADPAKKVVYFQTFQSGIFKIFPNFGIIHDNYCQTCPNSQKVNNYKKYKFGNAKSIDVDTVVFLNFLKYKFLIKETFLPLETIEKDIYFDFDQKVRNGIYKSYGSLLDCNKKSCVYTLYNSKYISSNDKLLVLKYYKP